MNFWQQIAFSTRVILSILIALISMFLILILMRSGFIPWDPTLLARSADSSDANGDNPLPSSDNQEVPQLSNSSSNSFVRAIENVDIYNGPGVEFGIVGLLEEDQLAEVFGVSPDNLWWVINVPYAESGRGWVLAQTVTEEGEIDVPVVQNSSSTSNDGSLDQLRPEISALTNVNVRNGPGIDYQQIAVLRTGESAKVVGISADGQWWMVQGSEESGLEGWVTTQWVQANNTENVPVVSAQATEQPFFVPTPPVEAPKVTAISVVNIRNGPGIDFEIIGKLGISQEAELLGLNSDLTWAAINYPEGNDGRGWVNINFLTTQDAERVSILD